MRNSFYQTGSQLDSNMTLISIKFLPMVEFNLSLKNITPAAE